MNRTTVTDNQIKGVIANKVRKLKKADYRPQVFITDKKVYMSVIRLGICETLLISHRVAEELIAAGFAYEG
jgi:hypothetical protein